MECFLHVINKETKLDLYHSLTSDQGHYSILSAQMFTVDTRLALISKQSSKLSKKWICSFVAVVLCLDIQCKMFKPALLVCFQAARLSLKVLLIRSSPDVLLDFQSVSLHFAPCWCSSTIW